MKLWRIHFIMKVYKCIVNFKLTKFEIVLRQSVEIIRSQKEKKKKKKKKKKTLLIECVHRVSEVK